MSSRRFPLILNSPSCLFCRRTPLPQGVKVGDVALFSADFMVTSYSPPLPSHSNSERRATPATNISSSSLESFFLVYLSTSRVARLLLLSFFPRNPQGFQWTRLPRLLEHLPTGSPFLDLVLDPPNRPVLMPPFTRVLFFWMTSLSPRWTGWGGGLSLSFIISFPSLLLNYPL